MGCVLRVCHATDGEESAGRADRHGCDAEVGGLSERAEVRVRLAAEQAAQGRLSVRALPGRERVQIGIAEVDGDRAVRRLAKFTDRSICR